MALFFIILRLGVFSALLLLILSSVQKDRRHIFIAGAFAAVLGAVLAVVAFPVSGPKQGLLAAFLVWSHLLLLYLSMPVPKGYFPYIAVFFMLSPAWFHACLTVLDSAALTGASAYGAAAAGLLLSLGTAAYGSRPVSKMDLSRFIDNRSVYVILAAIWLVWSGAGGQDSGRLVALIQQTIASFLSSFIPFMRETLLFPEAGSILSPAEGPFEFLSSERMAMAVTAVLIFLPPVSAFVRLLLSREPDVGNVDKKAVRRKLISIHRDELLRRGTPLLVSFLVGVISLHAVNLEARPSYDPEPVPVIAVGDIVTIPLKDVTGDISDGKLRKYSISYGKDTLRFMVIMRPDGEIAAALDACEVCPPRGYIQRGGHVICTYCNTPIAVSSIGSPGGCNPIPLVYETRGDALLIKKSEIITAYRREAGKETGSVLR